jgi:uncharacterized protein
MLLPLPEENIFQTLINCSSMLIQRSQVGNKGMFYVGQEGVIEAELVYHIQSEGKMVIEHTEVGDSLAGKGVGRELVETAVEYARSHNLKIVPLCPFAKSLFDHLPAWNDVLA